MTLRKNRRDDGYTMVEIMIVVAILAILVMIAITSYVVATSNARGVTCQHNQRLFQDAVFVYAAQQNEDPAAIDNLRSFVNNYDENIKCPNGDGVNLQYDAVSHAISCPNHP